MKQDNALNAALAPLRQRWTRLAQREQNLLLIAGSIVLLALVWWIALAPALHSLRTAPARHAAADRELQTMLQMQAQAELLRQQSQTNNAEADVRTQLEQSIKTELAATAQTQWLGNRVQITLTNAPAPALTRWLSQVRDNSHAAVAEMKLNRITADMADATTRWSGNLLLDLPGHAGEPN